MIAVTLPWPPSELRPNRERTRHWRSNASAAAAYKAVCFVSLRAQGLVPLCLDNTTVALTIRFCPPSRRKYDRDGSLSAFKAGMDALAHHLGMDDDDFEPITICRGPVIKGGSVEVLIHEE